MPANAEETAREAAAVAHSPEDARAPFEPVLAQQEVDELIGFEEEDPPAAADLRASLASGRVALEPMPVLDVVLDRLRRTGSAALRSLFGCEAELGSEDLEARRFGDYLDELPLPAQLFVFQAAEWSGSGLLTLEAGADHIILDRLLGGGRRGGRSRPTARPPTAIEGGLLSRFADALLKEVERSFAQISPVTFSLSGLEANPRTVQIARAGDGVLVAPLKLVMDGREARFHLVLPLATLEPVRHLLAGRFTGEKLGQDPVWSAHLATEVWEASIEANAVLHEMRLPLGRILDLAIGDTLMFDLKPSDLICVRSGGLLLTRGRMGRVDGRIAVQITEPLRSTRLPSETQPNGPRRLAG